MDNKVIQDGGFGESLKRLIDVFGKNDFEQFIVRFVIACVVVIYTSTGKHPNDVQVFSQFISMQQAFSFAYLITLCLLSCYVYLIKPKNAYSRLLMMIVDVIFFSSSLAIIPETATPLFFVYLLIIFGFGFRFGTKYLLAGMSLSLTGFISAFVYSEYWHENIQFGLGYLFVMLIGSVYVALFIRRLNVVMRKMEEAVAKADSANEAKSKFLANMTHELRTPLNGVISISELISETDLSKEQQEYADTIQTSARTLLELVNDVLDFSKIESEKIILDKVCFNLHACIDDVVKMIKPIAGEKNLSVYSNVSSGIPKFIYGDPVRLKQVIINLANNAVKFTERGHVSLHVYTVNVSGSKARFCIEVIDTGIGISQEAQSRIFERFVQEDDSTTRRFGGTGLGISISKQLVELMGGSIGVTSNKGKGSRFWFEIDAELAEGENLRVLEADVILVSENEKQANQWLKFISGWSYKGIVKSNINEALEVLKVWRHTKRKCYVILDEDALHMSPVRAVQIVKETRVREIITILVTSSPMQKNNPGVQASFDFVLDFPVDSRDLYHAFMKGETYNVNEGVVSLAARIDKRSHQRAQALNILVAEDQSTNQFVFKRILDTQGHKVTIVQDGQQALDILAVEKFDVAIVDLNMPYISGLEVINLFKYMQPDNEMPFVVVTANSRQETLKECREIAEAVLVKPIEKQQLLDVIYKLANKEVSTDYIGQEDYSNYPVMDMEALSNMLGSDCDYEFLSELFDIFGNDSEKLINDLFRNLRSKSSFSEAKNNAHSLKGIANNVSAIRLAEIAKQCENQILSNPDVAMTADKLYKELQSCLMATREEMKNYLSIKSSLVDL